MLIIFDIYKTLIVKLDILKSMRTVHGGIRDREIFFNRSAVGFSKSVNETNGTLMTVSRVSFTMVSTEF